MDDWECVLETIEFLATGLGDMADATVDLERQEFLLPNGETDDGDDRWDFHESMRSWLEEYDFLRRELDWMEFHLDTPLRADRFRYRLDQWLRLAADAADWPLMATEDFERRAAALKKDLALAADYCVELHNFMLRLADSKTDRKKSPVARLPRNPDVLKLAREVQRRSRKGETREQIAREIADGNERQAESMLRQLRRYSHLLENGEADT
jgi:hypothetical protein